MILILIVAALIISVAAISYYTYRQVFLADRKRQGNYMRGTERAGRKSEQLREMIKEFSEIRAEDVYIYSFDGLKLHGRYYHICDDVPLDIQFHGYNGNAFRDFCGGNKISREAGRNSLVVDQRAHGMSEGRTITFGINERKDCLSWIEYAIDRFGPETEIILSGVSMGASTVLMALSLELPGNVKAVIADCGYSSPKAIIKKVTGDRGFPPGLVYPFIWLGGLIFGRFCLTDLSAAASASASKVPVLIIHGEADDFVPSYMADEIYSACGSEKDILIVPGAGHGLSYVVDSDLYERTVKEFISKHVGSIYTKGAEEPFDII